jgi:hypothetical protein
MMEEENFQTWLAHNRNQPLSEEVTRLQSLVTRLEARHGTDYRRLRRAESEWWSLLRKGFLVSLGLVAVLLWYLNSYLETRVRSKWCAGSSRARRRTRLGMMHGA